MNRSMSPEEIDPLLELLEHGLVAIRIAALDGDTERAFAIADALHNVPRLILAGDTWGWTLAELHDSFLDGLVATLPSFADSVSRVPR